MSVLLVDVDAMSALHVQWMDEPGPTDVLSFPMDELRPGREGAPSEPGLLGDVVLCPEVAATQAKTAGHATAEELLLLATHGILHLLGYDHADPEEEKEMFELQRRLLLTFLSGVPGDAAIPSGTRAIDPTVGSGRARARERLMGVPSALLVVLGLLLVALAGLFAAAETAMVRVSRADAAKRAADGQRGAAALVRVLNDPAPVVNVTIFLRVATEAAAAVCVALVVDAQVQRWWVVLLLATAVMGSVSFVLVGVSPRTVARQHPERVALLMAPVLRAVTTFLGPIARLLVVIGNVVTPGRGYRQGPFASESELRDLVDLATESEVIEAVERKMIHSVFELGDTLVREVMVPRTDMVTIECGATLEQGMRLFLRSGFSRIPVIGEGVDDPLGMLYLKDVARRLHSDHPENATQVVERAMRPPVFVPESKRVDALLREMQGESAHVALVVDEYGGIAGLVTIEDLVEEIVGEINDEYDREAATVESLEDGVFRVSARLSIDEMAELFGVEIEEDEVDSVGGLLAKTLGKVPIAGAVATVAGLVLTAERMEGRRNRIATVLVTREQEPTAGSGTDVTDANETEDGVERDQPADRDERADAGSGAA